MLRGLNLVDYDTSSRAFAYLLEECGIDRNKAHMTCDSDEMLYDVATYQLMYILDEVKRQLGVRSKCNM